MRRLIAILIGVAVASTAGQAAAWHTHVYPDPDRHPHEHEHQHGLAAHAHHPVDARRADGAPEFDDCDPGLHAVSVVLACDQVTREQPLAADGGVPSVVQPLPIVHVIAPLAEPRAHGPPSSGPTSPRPPPPRPS